MQEPVDASGNPLPDTIKTKPLATIKGPSGAIVALAFSPDRSLLAVARREGEGRIWDVGGTPGQRSVFGASDSKYGSLAFSPNGRTLVVGSGSLDGRVKLLDVTEKLPCELATLRGGRGAVHAVAVSPDSKLVAGVGEDRTLRVWEPGSSTRDEPRSQLAGHAGTITCLAFAPDSQGVATAARDATVRLWSLGRIRSWQRASFPHPGEVTSVAWSADGKLVATGCQDGIARVWDPTGIKTSPLAQLGRSGPAIRLVAFSSEKGILVTVGEDMKVINWDPHVGRVVRDWQLPACDQPALALTRDGRYLAMGKTDGVVEIFRVAERR